MTFKDWIRGLHAEKHYADSEPRTEAFTSAAELRAYMQEVRLARAEEKWADLDKETEAKKKYMARLMQPIEITDDRVMSVVERMKALARENLSEMMIIRFPSELLADGGRRINQGELGWEDTLVGVPRQVYECWHERLRPLGYRMTASILEFPGGLPGDVGLFLDWEKPSHHPE